MSVQETGNFFMLKRLCDMPVNLDKYGFILPVVSNNFKTVVLLLTWK